MSPDWSKNCEDERLLGVSITGIMDNPLLNGKSKNFNFWDLSELLNNLRTHAININKIWAKKLGIEEAKAVTCCKPSGTVSALVNSASGIHPRWSQFYLRSVRANKTESIAKFMIKEGFPHELDITNPEQTYIFYFPIKFDGDHNTSIFRGEQTAIEQLEFWKVYKDNWTEHNPSVTIYVKEHEWIEVAAWVYKHFDDICGVSFLPYTEHIYKQAPFSECTEEEYENWMKKMPKDVDWSKLSEFEEEDLTTSAQEFACSGGSCEFVDVTN
jgi:ribonucleoside-diphosphate reductase alpha chain